MNYRYGFKSTINCIKPHIEREMYPMLQYIVTLCSKPVVMHLLHTLKSIMPLTLVSPSVREQ